MPPTTNIVLLQSQRRVSRVRFRPIYPWQTFPLIWEMHIVVEDLLCHAHATTTVCGSEYSRDLRRWPEVSMSKSDLQAIHRRGFRSFRATSSVGWWIRVRMSLSLSTTRVGWSEQARIVRFRVRCLSEPLRSWLYSMGSLSGLAKPSQLQLPPPAAVYHYRLRTFHASALCARTIPPGESAHAMDCRYMSSVAQLGTAAQRIASHRISLHVPGISPDLSLEQWLRIARPPVQLITTVFADSPG